MLQAEAALAHIGQNAAELTQTVEQVRQLLGLARPQGLKADEVIKSTDQ